MLRYIDTKEQWKGERIDGVAHSKTIETLKDADGNLSWSDEDLAVIGLERYTPPVVEPKPLDPLASPINRMQFKATLRLNNLLDAVANAIDALPDPVMKAIVLTKFEENDWYRRDDPLFTTLGNALNLTSDQIDAMWVQAQGIK